MYSLLIQLYAKHAGN